MKQFLTEFWAARGRALVIQLVLIAAAAAAVLAVYGRLQFITGVFVGYLLAGICAWTMIYRTWKASAMSVRRAKVQMWLGMIMRFLMVFVLLYAAMQRSGELFLVSAGAFIIGFALYMVHLCIFVYHKNMG